MKSETITIQNMFQDRRQYCVPFYQRAYVWTLRDQWEQLWDDIREKADARIAKRNATPHFLGAVVLDPQDREGLIGVDLLHIIDGQQRFQGNSPQSNTHERNHGEGDCHESDCQEGKSKGCCRNEISEAQSASSDIRMNFAPSMNNECRAKADTHKSSNASLPSCAYPKPSHTLEEIACRALQNAWGTDATIPAP